MYFWQRSVVLTVFGQGSSFQGLITKTSQPTHISLSLSLSPFSLLSLSLSLSLSRPHFHHLPLCRYCHVKTRCLAGNMVRPLEEQVRGLPAKVEKTCQKIEQWHKVCFFFYYHLKGNCHGQGSKNRLPRRHLTTCSAALATRKKSWSPFLSRNLALGESSKATV